MCKTDLCWGILAHLHQWNVTLHCWAHLRFMKLLQGFACGKQMGASWSSSPLFLTRSLFANWLILSHQLTTSPNQTCHSATASTHTIQQTPHSTLLLYIKCHLPSALPSVNSLNNPCHLLALLWLIQPRHTLCNLSVNLSAPPRSHFSQILRQFPVFSPISNKRQNPSLI